MAHAHPLPDGFCLPSHLSSHHLNNPTYASSTAATPNSRLINLPRQQDQVSHQKRRLQLRNAGFRAPVLPARRISPFFSNTTPVFEQPTSAQTVHSENSPGASERRTLYGEDLPPSPVSILQEISNSSRRVRQSPRPAISTIFQDSTATEGTGAATSWYHEASNNPSPLQQPEKSPKMPKLREVSLNEKTPPIFNSPPAKQAKGRKKTKLHLRSASFEATKYIEHLESQLGSLNTRMEALTSPTTAKTQAAKLRGLHSQVRSQRQELSEWEKKFGERVDDEIYRRTKLEAGLKLRIQTLEEEAQVKDMKIKELGWELESALIKAREAESLGTTNQNLERRVDVLTELLAQSPTRTSLHSASAPGGNDSVASPKRTPRPKSLMLPRIPSSPGATRFSSNIGIDTSAWYGRNSLSASSISESPDEEITQSLDGALAAAAHNSLDFSNTRSTSVQSSIDQATFSRPGASVSSRPTSVISSSSFGASWGLPPPVGVSEDPRSASRPRKMRRFPSGSCALKPLVLPTTTVTQSLPASAPVHGSYDYPSREASNSSIDPTSAFLSRPQDRSPFVTPTQPVRRRSATWAQNQALKALEGKAQWTPDDEIRHSESKDAAHEVLFDEEKSITVEDLPSSRLTKRRSLQAELEQAQKLGLGMSDITSASADGSAKCDTDKTYRVRSPEGELILGALKAAYHPSHRSPLLRRHCSPEQSVSIPEHSPRSSALPPSPEKTSASSALISNNPVTIFSRLPGLVTSIKHDPLSLARTILRNAWSTGRSSRLGGLGWWLLGLIFRSRRKKRTDKADEKAVEEEPASGWDWSSYSAEASKRRRVDSHVQEMRDTTRKRMSRDELGRAEHSDDFEGVEGMAVSPSALRIFEVPIQPLAYRCEDCVEPSSRRSFRLWLRFSLAIVLAIGVAIKDGPGALLVDMPLQHRLIDEPARRKRDQTVHHDERRSSRTRRSEQRAQPVPSRELSTPKGQGGGKTPNPNEGYWGWEATFVENLGPADFQRVSP